MDTRGQYGNRAGLIGNPIQQTTDAYGNPLPSQEGTGLHGTTGVGGGGKPQMTHPEKEQRGGGILHRSGSSSSSSSEDDGMGGRRKKGLKEKIKEKLPGGRKTDEQGQGYSQGQTATGPGTGYGGTTTATTGTAGHNDPEKKDFMGKIKENLPGGRKTDEQGPGQGYGHVPITTGPGTGYGGTTTGPGTGYGGTTTATTGTAGHNNPEKKGFMGKIKENLPGGRKTDEQGQGQGYGHVPITTGPGTGYGGTTTATTGTAGHNDPEKMGCMGKIKEKLPGGRKTDEQGQGQGYGHVPITTGPATGYGGTTTATTGTAGHNDPEKKGFMGKIKEKLPGHQ